MAIISCPECGRQVSDKALKCRECGHLIANLETTEQTPVTPKEALAEPENMLTKWLTMIGIASLVVGVGLTIAITRARQADSDRQVTLSQPITVNQPVTPNQQTLPPPAVESKVSTSSPEYLLAGIDKQSRDVSASELVPYTQLLDQLEPKCQESRMALADISAIANDILAKKGAKSTNLELLNGVYGAVRHYKTPQKCASGFAMFATYVDK